VVKYAETALDMIPHDDQFYAGAGIVDLEHHLLGERRTWISRLRVMSNWVDAAQQAGNIVLRLRHHLPRRIF
jgi:hypothetical protein